MLQSLRIEGYRAFSDYRLDGLSRVNLLVGKNNCGKTSVLEAVQLLASEGDPEVMAQIAHDRGEIVMAADDFNGGTRHLYPNVSHLFREHLIEPESCFSIASEDERERIQVEVIEASQSEARQLRLPGMKPNRDDYVLCVRNPQRDSCDPRWAWPLRMSEEGFLLVQPRPPFYAPMRVRRNRPLVSHVGCGGSSRPPLNQMWNSVVMNGRENEVVEAMRILEPRVKGLYLLVEPPPRNSGGFFLAMEGQQRRYPIGTHGAGMVRLLTLALAVISAKTGTLLIDEIDTGLHYSVLGDMWRLVVETARKTDAQVFATTHSLDCVRGLAWLCEHYPDLGKEVSLQKIEPKLEHSVALDAGEIALAIEQGVEVR